MFDQFPFSHYKMTYFVGLYNENLDTDKLAGVERVKSVQRGVNNTCHLVVSVFFLHFSFFSNKICFWLDKV